MLKIIHLTDIHISGKNFDKCAKAFELVEKQVEIYKPELIIIDGDDFNKPSIADKLKSLGEQQGLYKKFLKNISKGRDLILNEGNHTKAGQQKSALEFLKDDYTVVQEPNVFTYVDEIGRPICKIGCMPWITKAIFYAKKCVGKSKTESNQMFSESIHNMLGYFKSEFQKGDNLPRLMFGHAEIAGYKLNKGHMFTPGSFTFNEGMLKSIGTNFMSFGHIHKRGGLYCGALIQHDFGEEGNPQGFELITIKNGEISEEWIELDLPKFITKEIHNEKDFANLNWNNRDSFKLRFYCEKSFNSCKKEILENSVVEQLFNIQEYVSRTEKELSAEMSFPDLLEEYIKLHELPEGITIKDIQEAVA